MVAEGGEGENPLPFSLTAPPKQPFQPTPTPRGLGGFCGEKAPGPWWAGPQALGARAPSPLETRTGQAWIPPVSPCSQVFNFLQRKPMGSGLKTLGCYHNPQSADLGGRWMVSEGGALQSHERRVPVFAPAFQVQAPENLANKPLSPASRQPSRVKNSKNAHRLMKSLACCTD